MIFTPQSGYGVWETPEQIAVPDNTVSAFLFGIGLAGIAVARWFFRQIISDADLP